MKAARRDPYKKLSDEEIRLARLWYKEDGIEPAEIAELLRRAEVPIRSVRRSFLAQLRHSHAMRKPGGYCDVCRDLNKCRRFRTCWLAAFLDYMVAQADANHEPATACSLESELRAVPTRSRHSYVTVTSQLRHSYVMRKLG